MESGNPLPSGSARPPGRAPVAQTSFDAVLALAADLCGTPMAAVTSYEEGHIRIESQHGIVGEPATSFCDMAVLQDTLLEIADTHADPRYRDFPEVREAPYVRFYAGAPLISSAGKRLGTLAVLDIVPRRLDAAQRERLATLASQVVVHIELRRRHQELEGLAGELDLANVRLREQAEQLKQAQQLARIGTWTYDLAHDRLDLSDEILRLFGLPPVRCRMTMERFVSKVHPEDRRGLHGAIDAAIRDGHARIQCRLDREDGTRRSLDIIGRLFCDRSGCNYLAGTAQDITEQTQAEARIRHLAYFDQLTGLPNRQAVLDRIERIVAMRRRMQYDGAVLFIDLDNFKTLNDTHGHDTGDMLLRQVARRLQSCVREYDCVGRFGGDEFVVVLEQIGLSDTDGATHALHAAQKILGALNAPYALGQLQHRITPSIGIALIGSDAPTTSELLKRADMAMYRAKAEGRNAIRFFSPQMQAAMHERAAMEADLRQAIAEHAFYLDYQPQVDGSGRMDGAEALLRWRHPVRGQVPPAQFIPLAEELGVIMEIGGWLLEEACAQLVRWSADEATRSLALSINVSARQFHHPDFVSQILEAIERSGADPHLLKIEITESMLIADVDDTRKKMMVLKAAGVRFALDDFGTGYSSLAYLQRLPLDQLKIDQSFVHHVMTDRNDAAITRSIIALARNLGLSVIAEGVETEDQRDFLAGEGCANFQGFLYHEPAQAEVIAARVGQRLH